MVVNFRFVQLGEAEIEIVLGIALGSLPLAGWVVRTATGKDLSQQGTGNISVAAAFQQAGGPVGMLAALAEAAKGIIAVLLARLLVPQAPVWELLALAGLVIGRYRYGGSAGSTNVFWGLLIHAPGVTATTAAIGGLGFGLMRRPRFWQYAVLVLFCGGMALRYGEQPDRVAGAIALCTLLALVYGQLPNDVTRGDSMQSLEHSLDADQVGQKAATLSDLKRAGFPVVEGWIVPRGMALTPVLDALDPTEAHPLIVRSSAVGEDQLRASAAGQYETIANVTNREELQRAIEQCFASYDQPAAQQYRRDRGLEDSSMAALIQRQVVGRYSGVAFSRDPIAQQRQGVLVEGLPGGADRVVSGEATPEQYRVTVRLENLADSDAQTVPGELPDSADLAIAGAGSVPWRVVQRAAYLARQVERHYHGIPQDVEWTYDGDRLWLLQSRPITTMLPIWTRKIASEVLPGVIRPLTWSINQPITCGVWGKIFTLMLGEHRASYLNFDRTATLHYGHTYFNASLIGSIFERLGLPPESLEFLTLGESFSPPSPLMMGRNLPGLGRLLKREWQLEAQFHQEDETFFRPELDRLCQKPLEAIAPTDLHRHIDAVLKVLERITEYNILAPLSASIRQAVLPIDENELDFSQTPEVAALRSLQSLAVETRQQFEADDELPALEAAMEADDSDGLLASLGQTSQGKAILHQLQSIVETYGYLSESATDIAVPTWRENPRPAQNLFVQFLRNPPNSPRSP